MSRYGLWVQTTQTTPDFGAALTGFVGAWNRLQVGQQSSTNDLAQFLTNWGDLPDRAPAVSTIPISEIAVLEPAPPVGFDFVDTLSPFLERWANLPAKSALTLSRLRSFVDTWHTLPAAPSLPPPTPTPVLSVEALNGFLAVFKPAYENHRRAGGGLNLWEVAGLDSSELRIARVLGWLLDGRRHHGLDNALLCTLLQQVQSRKEGVGWPGGFPTADDVEKSQGVRIRVESCPLGDIEDRVDIEIDSDRFVLFIEVKVHAGEGDQQLARYLAAAETKAAGRSWGVLFLTRRGTLHRTHLKQPRVVDISWKEVAAALSALLKSEQCGLPGVVVAMCWHYAQFVQRL